MIDNFLDHMRQAAFRIMGQLPAVLLGAICVGLGAMLLRRPGILIGAIGSFVGVTGIEILLWSFGIRLEILGSASFDGDASIASWARPRRRHDLRQEGIYDFAERKEREVAARAQQQESFNLRVEQLSQEIKVTELELKLHELRRLRDATDVKPPSASGSVSA